jgi:hypothetical protein
MLWSSNPTVLAHEREELGLAEATLDTLTRGDDFFSLHNAAGTEIIDGSYYEESVSVADISRCLKTVSVTEDAGGLLDFVELSVRVPDLVGMRALGHDCEITEPDGPWAAIHTHASDSSITSATALDALGEYAYLGLAASPYLAVADLAHAREGQGSGLALSYTNGFSLYAAPNALDAVSINGHRYVFAALATSTKQLAVVTVDTPAAPVLAATRTLANVDATGSFPQGWRLLYYDGYLYINTRETKGAELHVFDASDPSFPVERGSGTAVDITLNDFVVQTVGTKKYLFAATARDTGELAVYDVTDPSNITEVTTARTDLAGSQDGQSVALLGSRLYLGRQSVPAGDDLYAYDIRDPLHGVEYLGSADIGTGVTSIRADSNFLYLGTVKSGKQVQAWDAHDPSRMLPLSTFSLQGLADRGFDYADGRLIVAGSGSTTFSLLSGD